MAIVDVPDGPPPGSTAPQRGTGTAPQAVAVATQVGIALVLPVAPMLTYHLVANATDRATTASPGEEWFVDGYGGPALFLNGMLALVHLVVATTLVGFALRGWSRRRPQGRAAMILPWLAFGLMACAVVANPGSSVDFGEPDGFALVRGSLPDWYPPALAALWLTVGGLALVNTLALWRARNRV